MMRSVLNGGTGSGARSAGFTLDAAGKTGTTNDLRDAWFVGFTPELLTAVWVGFDDFSQPVGLTGAQAALPIWTEFMKRALAGHGVALAMAARSFLAMASRKMRFAGYTLVLDDNWPSRRTAESLGARVTGNFVTYRRDL